MRVVLQRVSEASVVVDGRVVGEIGKGFVALVGVSGLDTVATAEKMAEKIAKLRVFPDENGKTNLSSSDVGGEILIISQFTLYADCRKGNRPNFMGAGSPQHAREVCDIFAKICERSFFRVQTGVFGAHMRVSLINDGPFTLTLDSDDILKSC